MSNSHATCGAKENPISNMTGAIHSAGIGGTEPSIFQTLPSSYDEGTGISYHTQGVSGEKSWGKKTSLKVSKKALSGRLDETLLKRAESIIDGFDYVDPLNATVNMESLRGVVFELWESAATSSEYHQDILAALESAILSIDIPNEDQLSVFREAIRDLRNGVLTAEHVDIIRRQFAVNGFSPLALLDEAEDGNSTNKSQD